LPFTNHGFTSFIALAKVPAVTDGTDVVFGDVLVREDAVAHGVADPVGDGRFQLGGQLADGGLGPPAAERQVRSDDLGRILWRHSLTQLAITIFTFFT
jgi:hypothetical protein